MCLTCNSTCLSASNGCFSFQPLLQLCATPFDVVKACCTTDVCVSHNSHVKWNIITKALKSNSVRLQKMKGGGGDHAQVIAFS